MIKFMILYMTSISAEEQMNVSTEEMEKKMEPWMAWYKKAGKAIVDAGTPLVKGMHFTKSGSSKGKTEVTGYSIVQTKDIETIKAMLTDHPHLMIPKSSIEIFEMLPMI